VCVCRISVPSVTALLLLAALNACCHSRTPLYGLYFEQTLCLLRTKTCGVSKMFLASLSSSSRAPCCDALVGWLFSGGDGGCGGHVCVCVGGVKCAIQLRRLVRRPYARSPLSCRPLLVFMQIICSTPTSNTSQTSRASYWYRHKGARRRSTDCGPQPRAGS